MHRPSLPSVLWPVVFAMIIVANNIPKNPCAVILRVSADQVEVRLGGTRPWTWPGRLPASGPLTLSGVSSLKSGLDKFKPIETPNADAWITVDGGSVSLDGLTFDQRGMLAISVPDEGWIQFVLSADALQGQFQILSDAMITAGTSAPKPLFDESLSTVRIPENISFRMSGSGSPVMLDVRNAHSTRFRNIPVQGLRFQQEVTRGPGERVLESTIHGGSLLLADISKQYDIQESQDLRFDGLVGTASVLVGRSIDLVFVGTARRVDIGFFDSLRDITPSWLDVGYYVFTHHVLLLVLMSTSVALWQLWQTRKKLLDVLR